MEDKRTGELVPIDLGISKMTFEEMAQHRVDQLQDLSTQLQDAGLEAGIPKEHQGPIFVKGEIVELKGKKFKIHGIGNKEIVLRIVK